MAQIPKKTEKLTEKKSKKSISNNKLSNTKKTNGTLQTNSKNTNSNSKLGIKAKSNKKNLSKKIIKQKNTIIKNSNINSNIKKDNSTKNFNGLEYYDLPYRYNKTLVKILAQTPKTLFVYWDISDKDRIDYIKQFGEHFFENTKPVLIIHNTTMNYSFEIEINDFANCWYFNVNDEKCEYLVELGRRTKSNNLKPNNYFYITSSNKIESPNGHILFEKEQKILYFKNIKTNKVYSKNIANLKFIKYLGKVYNMYKKLYSTDETLDINNPTSNFK